MKQLAVLFALALVVESAVSQSVPSKSSAEIDYSAIDALFEKYMRDNHAPGVVYGVVHEGKLIRVKTFGVQDNRTQTPITADTLFPIASMTKNFTALAALKLRDQGRLQFDEPVERYAPEFKSIRYPTSDSPKIRVRDLLSHSGGFVYDDPWGDRQMDMSDAAFDAFLRSGFPLSRTPQISYEYSNFGFAMMGRVIRNVSGRAYSDYIALGATTPVLVRRPVAERGDASGCDTAWVYGLGMTSRTDCKLGMWLTHGGRFPGYGSDVIMLPQRGVGIFVFSNLTYGPTHVPVLQAARQLVESGAFPVRSVPISNELMAIKDTAARIYATGDVLVAREALAMNFLLDNDAAHRNAGLAKLKSELGPCSKLESVTATTAMRGEAIWTCEHGRLRATIFLAPTVQPSLQTLDWEKVK